MLLDINASVGHWPFQKYELSSLSGLLGHMDKYGVAISVVSNLNGIFYKNTQAANEELYEELKSDKRFEGRFIPFGIINPIYAGWKNDFEVCTGKFGMKGIRISPLYHDYELTDPACLELVKMARDRNIPVALHTRIVDSRARSWMDITAEWSLRDIMPLIREVPDAKYMILNVANGVDLEQADMDLFRKTAVLMDTSGRSLMNPGELLKTFGVEKFAFGTHSPILAYLTGLLRIEALTSDEADDNTRELLRSGNARKMLGG
jgi:predicted TIM-barrel fold metal-dependent hydrolase